MHHNFPAFSAKNPIFVSFCSPPAQPSGSRTPGPYLLPVLSSRTKCPFFSIKPPQNIQQTGKCKKSSEGQIPFASVAPPGTPLAVVLPLARLPASGKLCIQAYQISPVCLLLLYVGYFFLELLSKFRARRQPFRLLLRPTMIRCVFVVNTHGKPRIVRFYDGTVSHFCFEILQKFPFSLGVLSFLPAQPPRATAASLFRASAAT